MMELTASKALRGEVTVPGDKSISHRSVMFGAIAQGTTEVTNFLQGADCLSTISCFQKLGIEIENTPERILVHGKGLHGLSAPSEVLDAGNSGTTTRLISGILSGQTFETTLTGDASIQKRPMKRIMEPLSLMGAKIESVRKNGCAASHHRQQPARDYLFHAGRIRTGQILDPALRSLCGWSDERNRACSQPQPHGADAFRFRRRYLL